MVFEPIPLAVREATRIAAIWKRSAMKDRSVGDAMLLTDADATENAIKREAPRHLVLHLATHAFFRDATPEDPIEGSLLRSAGLALAGANRGTVSGEGGDSEDGVLTAEEIATLDLRGVDLAVLSGCDTGRGHIVSGEGVMGLRRAFENAGVGALVMSLWPVRDDSALEWMDALYEARTPGGRFPDAFRAAALKVVFRRRAAGMPDHPSAWGGFIATGEWR
jgi:CHAT domain-containing protein